MYPHPFRTISAAALAMVALAGAARAAESSFTYQGHLVLSGVPVTGTYDFEFSLHDDPSTGGQVGAAMTAEDLAVREGLFQAPLDFGEAAFDGTPRWLQIAVRDGASTESFGALSPRTRVSRTPVAFHALKADTATSAAFAVESAHAANADTATNAGFATLSASADNATTAGFASEAAHAELAALADTATSAVFASDSASLGGQLPSSFAASGHTHDGATIVDSSVDVSDLTTNSASLARVSGGAVVVGAGGQVGIGTASPAAKLDVRGLAHVAASLMVGPERNGAVFYDAGNNAVRVASRGEGIDQQQPAPDGVLASGSSFWQSFTPSVDGELVQFDLLRDAGAATATLTIHRGEGTGQPALQSAIVPFASSAQWQTVVLPTPVALFGGEIYTAALNGEGGGNLIWLVNTTNPYPAGRANYNPTRDFLFRTHVRGPVTGLGIESGTGDVTLSGNLNLGGAGSISNPTTISLAASPGDPAPTISSRVIPDTQGGSNEATEMILFHSNDNNNGYGPDYITLRAPALRLQTYSSGGVSSPDHDLGSNDRLVIDSNGHVAISQNLTVNGQAYKPGGGSWATISDSRTKKNISTISGALEKLLQLRGVTYQWKEPASVGATDDSPLMGLVADEVEKVFPEWISRGPDGLRRLEIVGFEGLVVEALKEIETRHDQEQDELRKDLESRIEQLQTQNEELLRRLDRLEKQSAN